jgi:hypothetical protein
MKSTLSSIVVFAFFLGISGCGSHSPSHDDIYGHGHGHNPDGSHITEYVPTGTDKTNLVMAYLSYIGEQLVSPANETKTILARINKVMLEIPQVQDRKGKVDWKVVWGPAIYTFPLAEYQDNGMFVAQQISNPTNYIVAIRGTNFIAVLDWVFEDFDVLIQRDWNDGSGSPKISEATHEGVKVLNDFLRPNPGMPGAGQSLKQFLTGVAQFTPINVSFTGHSLGGALAPTLALHFAQEQGKAGGWDPNKNSIVTSTSFAGATAGNEDFAKQTLKVMGQRMRRIHDTNDVVPHAWQTLSMYKIEDLYKSQGLKMDFAMKVALKGVIEFSKDKDYTQIDYSLPFNFPIDRSHGDTYTAQMSYQHTHSYPVHMLGHIEGLKLITLVNENKGK